MKELINPHPENEKIVYFDVSSISKDGSSIYLQWYDADARNCGAVVAIPFSVKEYGYGDDVHCIYDQEYNTIIATHHVGDELESGIIPIEEIKRQIEDYFEIKRNRKPTDQEQYNSFIESGFDVSILYPFHNWKMGLDSESRNLYVSRGMAVSYGILSGAYDMDDITQIEDSDGNLHDVTVEEFQNITMAYAKYLSDGKKKLFGT